PIRMYAIKTEAGPPFFSTVPEPMNKPVPIEPPIDIICKCLPFKALLNGAFAVARAVCS
ncbi:hypothetical protein METBIDRAFT_24145, partial [Metschnikowia bicuspidata var. bicuspidata NRRL YB-4993]